MFSPLSVCLYTGYLKKLWTDSDETWWTCWVCDEEELISFFGEHPDLDPDLIILKMILHH